MVKTTRLLATAGMLLAAMAAPPANADQPEWTGFTCGFASTNDPTGVVNQDPNAQTGVMNTGGVLGIDILADDLSGLSPHFPLESLLPGTITQHCWIQVNDASYATHGSISTAHCDFNSIINGVPGPMLLLPQGCTIAYSAGPTDNVYQCTTWTFRHDGPPHDDEEYRWDDPSGTAIHETDPAYSTAQCSLAISAGA